MFITSTKKPPVWMLIGVTYGVCAALTIGAAVAYFRWSTVGNEPVAGEMDKAGPIAIGSLWLPPYPGAKVVGHATSRNGDATETTLNLKSSDPADRMVMFYEGKLKGGRFRLNSFKKDPLGGDIDASLRNGKAQIRVMVRSVAGGSEASITALEKTF
jgi:hypothetical protein